MSEIFIKKIIFYTTGHNGDLHYSREFIKDVVSQVSNIEFEYRHNYSKKLLKDLKNITFSPFDLHHIYNNEISYTDSDNCLYINTWIGSSNCKHIPGEMGCSLLANYNKYSDVFKFLSISLKEIGYYIPSIDWSCFDTKDIDNFINKDKSYCLISNGDVLSGQAENFDFNPIIDRLSSEHENIDFLLTNNKHRLNKPNVHYTSDIIKTTENDLNEIGYLGTKCKTIVGRASGPYCFCHNKDVLHDPQKTLIVFSKLKNDGMWALPEQIPTNSANQIWSNNFDFNSICDIIKNSIKE